MARRFGAMNWLVVPMLRSPLRAVFGGRLGVLTVTGRKTGRPHTFPTMIAVDDDGMVVVAAWANEKSWWRNLRDEAPITVELEGRTVAARARALVAQDEERGRALRRYLRRFSRAAKSLGVSAPPDALDDAALGREAKGSVVVRIVPS